MSKSGEFVPDGFRAAEFDLVEYVGGARDAEEHAEFNVRTFSISVWSNPGSTQERT